MFCDANGHKTAATAQLFVLAFDGLVGQKFPLFIVGGVIGRRKQAVYAIRQLFGLCWSPYIGAFIKKANIDFHCFHLMPLN